MIRQSIFFTLCLMSLSACSTDYSDNDILVGSQEIRYTQTLPTSLTDYACPLRERSAWRVVRQEGTGYSLNLTAGDANTPLTLHFDGEKTGKAVVEVLHSTGTTEIVTIERTDSGTEQTVRVLQFNIWQEGTMVNGGYDAIVEEIARSGADFVTLSEVRNYSNVDFTAKLVASLKEKGLTYYSSRSDDTGILSRHPIASFSSVVPSSTGHGTIHKVVSEVGGQRFAVYTAHLDYTHYACYYPRGYDGVSFSKLAAPVTDTEKIRQMNLASKRDEQIAHFIADAKKEREEGSLVVLGGDFNEPSHLDWNYDTRNLYDHHGVVYNWDQSLSLQQAGFADTYRHLFPSPVTHPGFTYPADNPAATIAKLSWAPTADERERIDFLYYSPDVRWDVVNATLVGPEGTIVRGVRTPSDSQDAIVKPLGTWPSDHKALQVDFTVTRK